MSKQKKPNILPYSADEAAMVAAGGHVIPYSLVRLDAAVRKDAHDILIALAKQAQEEINMDWIEGGMSHDRIRSRINDSLEYILQDAEAIHEVAGAPISYSFGLDCLVDLALGKYMEEDGCGSADALRAQNPQTLIDRIHACMIALISIGHVQHAFDLARLAGALKQVETGLHGQLNMSDFLKKGRKSQHLTPYPDKLRVLRGIMAFTNNHELPTNKAVRIEVFGVDKDQGQFSRLISGMNIAKELPDEPKTQATIVEGRAYQAQSSPKYATLPAIGEGSARRIQDTNDTMDAVTTSNMLSIKPSGDPELIDRDIRKIKERLGPFYSLIRIQFGMSEIEEPEELKKFEQNLSDMGLALI